MECLQNEIFHTSGSGRRLAREHRNYAHSRRSANVEFARKALLNLGNTAAGARRCANGICCHRDCLPIVRRAVVGNYYLHSDCDGRDSGQSYTVPRFERPSRVAQVRRTDQVTVSGTLANAGKLLMRGVGHKAVEFFTRAEQFLHGRGEAREF
jgi:hypothetical protein